MVSGSGQSVPAARRSVVTRRQFLSYLANEYTGEKPLALIVGLANPHDVLAYPRIMNQLEEACGGAEYASSASYDYGVKLPYSYDHDDLATKPTAQAESKILYGAGLGAISGPPSLDACNYVNFYAHLHTVVDAHIGTVLDALQARKIAGQSMADGTVVIRTCDHGELGLAHDGLRQKMFNVYEETMHLPLVISNPVLFPSPVSTDAMAALVDLMPTVATLANVPNRGSWRFSGVDLYPVISDAMQHPTNPTISVQDTVAFTFDDEEAGTADGARYEDGTPVVKQPNHIRCIREAGWKYARYFDPNGVEADQCEMYKLDDDPDEISNLADPDNADYGKYASERTRLTAKLASVEAGALAPLPRVYLPFVQR
jgi:choline-sulfatase